jgi:hypothetical protein
MSEHEPVTKSEIERTQRWLKENNSQLPAEVVRVLLALFVIVEKLEPMSKRYKKILNLLLTAWDMTPASEKSSQLTLNGGAVSFSESAHFSCPRHQRSIVKKSAHRKKHVRLEPKEIQHPVTGESGCTSEKEKNISAGDSEERKNMPENPIRDVKRHTTYDLSFHWDITHNNVETLINPETGEKISGVIPDVDSNNGKYTFQTMLNIVNLHVGFQMPLTRIARMFSNSRIQLSKSTLFGFLVYVSRALLPVFYVLCEQLFKNAEVIEMDDFNSRVNKKGLDAIVGKDESELTPAEKILVDIDKNIGLTSKKVDKNKPKVKVNLTVFSGLLDKSKPLSRVVIKLTHIGGAGDLLGKFILKYRSVKKMLWIVSDLSSVNNAKGTGIEKYSIRQQGCIWHARRRFWHVRACSDECYHALRCFRDLAIIESWITNEQTDENETRRLRTMYSKKIFKILTNVCQGLLKTWGKESAVGDAANYVLTHEYALKQFLKNHELPAHNNRVERYGRPEKLMLSASKFRDTLSGRVVYDVISTVMSTCNASGISFISYALDVLRNQKAVAQNPEFWTPFAWAERQQTIQK